MPALTLCAVTAVVNSGVLPCREVRLIMKAAREEKLPISKGTVSKPVADRRSGLFGDLELHGSSGFLLDHRGTVGHSAADAHVVHP